MTVGRVGQEDVSAEEGVDRFGFLTEGLGEFGIQTNK